MHWIMWIGPNKDYNLQHSQLVFYLQYLEENYIYFHIYFFLCLVHKTNIIIDVSRITASFVFLYLSSEYGYIHNT